MEQSLLKCKKYVTNNLFIQKILALGLSLEEFLMLTYFDNDYQSFLDIEIFSQTLGIALPTAYQVFNSLLSKKLIQIESTKDREGRMVEKVNLDAFYNLILEKNEEEQKEKQETDIYDQFQEGFGRPISPMEYEIIKAWLDKGYQEELILGALKEAIYNGVNNCRYIDKILFEWNKRGLKTMEDVNNHLKVREKKEEKDSLFDYNWLDDPDE